MADNKLKPSSGIRGKPPLAIAFAVRKADDGFGSVLRLFCARSPSAIGGAVIAVIVNAVKRVKRRWHFAHVLQESLKGFSPFWADGNSAPAVPMIVGGFWIAASIPHARPNPVFALVRLPSKLIRLFINATTAAASSFGKSSSLNFALNTADASAEVIGDSAISAFCGTHDVPIRKGFTGKVNSVVGAFHACKYSTEMKLYGR